MKICQNIILIKFANQTNHWQ